MHPFFMILHNYDTIRCYYTVERERNTFKKMRPY